MQDQATIEKGIPIPVHQNTKYPFAQMEVGDSFVMNKPRPTAAVTASSWGKRHGVKFSIRAITATSSRVWMVK